MRYKWRRYFLYYLAVPLIWILSLLPRAMGMRVGSAAGRLAFWLLPRYRRITVDNLRSAFGSTKSTREIQDIAVRVFENLGKNAIEIINLPKLNKETIGRLVTIENRERLDAALENGRGVIIVTGHIGNWELLSVALRLTGYRGAVIGRKIYFDKFDTIINRLRRVHDVQVIYRDESPRRVLKLLRENCVIGIVADQDVDSVEGTFVNFFGTSAFTPIGPVQLARVSGAQLIPCCIIRDNGRHRIVIEEPIAIEKYADDESAIRQYTQQWSAVLERAIRSYPDQWVWMHRRWKTRPHS